MVFVRRHSGWRAFKQARLIVPVRTIAPGSFSGLAYFLGETNSELALPSEPPIVILPSLHADFLSIAACSRGVISRRGGAFSHLAIVLREMRIPGVVLCDSEFVFPTSSFLVSFPSETEPAGELICEY